MGFGSKIISNLKGERWKFPATFHGFFVIQFRVTRLQKLWCVWPWRTSPASLKTNKTAKKNRATMDVFGEKHSKKNTNMSKNAHFSASWLGRDFHPEGLKFEPIEQWSVHPVWLFYIVDYTTQSYEDYIYILSYYMDPY